MKEGLPRRWRGASVAVLVLLIMLGSACSGRSSGSGSPSATLQPSEVQRYVLVKEATANLTRLIVLLQEADATVQHVTEQPVGSRSSTNFLAGARLSWNNVVVALNYFTQGQAREVPELEAMVGTHKLVTTAWLNALDHLAKHRPSSRKDLLTQLADPQNQELEARPLIQAAAKALATAACKLQSKHHELATPGDTATACGTADQLAPAPST
jgi:hypothetical protein